MTIPEPRAAATLAPPPSDAPPVPVALIVARARNGVIGAGNRLPWHIPEELAHFKRTTMGHTMIMGRRTWESIGRPLPGRRTIVLSRSRLTLPPGVEQADSLPAALALHRATSGEQPFVVGGASVYDEARAIADRIVLTEVDLAPPGDAFFDAPDPLDWQPVGRQPGVGRDGTHYEIVEYRRRPPAPR
jgi:dihydrofolate reductase